MYMTLWLTIMLMKISILILKTLGSYENEIMDKIYFKQNRKLFVMCNSFDFDTDLGRILTKTIPVKCVKGVVFVSYS